jgi:peptide-methionine (S)-S-oxide reductase
VGYSGGMKPYPTYRNIKDHTEAVRVVFDPRIVSYADILEHFAGEGGLAKTASYSLQYRCAILVHSHEQHRQATDFVNTMQKIRKCQYFTDVEPAGDFYKAEEYHQKYIAKQGGGRGCGWC